VGGGEDGCAALCRWLAVDERFAEDLSHPPASIDRQHAGDRACSAHVFAAAYPSRTASAFDALVNGNGMVPDGAILWVDLRGSASRLLDGPPRGIDVGR
jgi:hypothetical protein